MVVESVVRGTRQNRDERATRRLGVRRRADTSPEAGPSSRARIVLTPELVDLASDEAGPSSRARIVLTPELVDLASDESTSSLREEEEEQEEELQTEEEELQTEEEELQTEEEERYYEGGDEEGYAQDGWGMGDRGKKD
ncbi:myelin transcription factor 1-like [Linepithema humile]|uniref:myelin transcription factor 1-like n=1 Tax=Linepithema humile TaxID=83485 RepID=UPI00351F53BB